MASGGSNKFTLEQVRAMCAVHGFDLVSNEYISNNHKLDVRCRCGTLTQMRLATIKDGHKCQTCRTKTISAKLRMSDEELRSFCEQKGCRLLRSWIKCKKTRIEYACRCGNTTEAYWTNFRNYPNCKKCGNKKVAGENCHMWNEDREEVASRKRFRKTCGRLIARVMKATGGKKADRSATLLGYTPEQLQEHILHHPNMASLRGKEWHVDHIFPIQAFLDHGIEDLQLINALDNLQPLEGSINIAKGDRYDVAEFQEWLTNHV